ncbi:MAG: hypothetical protein AVDCRST_MAG01-01-3538, partial [uncultured Rubrobacteraceae bacterium]
APLEEKPLGRRGGGAHTVRDLRCYLGWGIRSGLVRRLGRALVPRASVGVLPGGARLLRARSRRAVPRAGPRRRPRGQGRLSCPNHRSSAAQRALELRVLRPAQHASWVLGHSGVPGGPDGAYGRAPQVREVLLGVAAYPVLPVGAVRPRLDVRVVEAQWGGL